MTSLENSTKNDEMRESPAMNHQPSSKYVNGDIESGPFTSTPNPIQYTEIDANNSHNLYNEGNVNTKTPDEKTPLINRKGSSNKHVPFYNGNTANSDTNETKSDTRSETDEMDGHELHSHASKLNFLKLFLLSSLIIFTLITFIFINEKHETWTNVAVHVSEPIYIDLAEKLDVMFPVWNVHARGPFIPAEFANLTDDYVFFEIIHIVGAQREIIKGPWIAPVVSNYSYDVGTREADHTFDLSDEDLILLKNKDQFQLKISTNSDEPVSLSISISGFSELSLDGILLAGAVLIFLYILIIFEIVHRTLAAMIGATAAIMCLTLIRDRPPLEKVISWLDVETLSLLFGMMVLVAILCETGFFDYIAVLAFRLAKGQIWPLIFTLCIFTGTLSAFLDNVTTILLMTPVTIRLCEIKNLDPKHVLIALVVFSNIGGASTPVGDPPNVIIISSSKIQSQGVDFGRFTMHMLPGIFFAFIATLFLIRLLYRDSQKLRFQEPPELVVGKKRIMEYLRDEVDLLDSIEKCERKKFDTRTSLSFKINGKEYTPLNPIRSIIQETKSYPTDEIPSKWLRPPNEIRHEIDVWKKACNSISGYSRDENSVRSVLNKKVMALENLLRKHLYDTKPTEDDFQANLEELQNKFKIRNKPLLIKSAIVLGAVVLLFFMQSIPNLDLSLGWVAILGAILLLILADFEELDSIISRVEWSTLIFFAALFVVMEALAELKFLMWIGQLTQNAIISVHPDNRLLVAILIFVWVSALASSFIDNIPFTTVMVKILEDLIDNNTLGIPLQPLIYALAFGACLGGNGTLIGASANVVCAGVAEQHGYRFTFMDFFKVGFPVMLMTTFVSMIYLLICHVVLEWNY